MLQEDNDKSWDCDLKHKERLFVLHFCTDDMTFLNATQSYKCVYKDRDAKTGKVKDRSDEVCEAASSRLMAKAHIKAAITKLLQLTQADLDEHNSYQLLRDLMLMADFNPADILKPDGTLKVRKISDLGELAKCIANIQPGKFGPKITLVDRSKYMQMYLRYLDLIRPEVMVEEKLKVIALPDKVRSIDDWNAIAQRSEEVGA